ncbi:hypothetical protein AVEN_97017-1 [Araneus ventricosus]|uniref:Uncharacterized protein n=1 Tax=Araneus ventricosus TaxID=182803 RepID=A0A4Y2FER2_ARAVE|nr:hypothetical protein AVEN_97017-1 [Araneus ventricosus]
MESHFPVMCVLWLGREFYRGKYERPTAATSGPLTLATNLATILSTWRKFGDHLVDLAKIWRPSFLLVGKFGDFGDEIWDLKCAGIFPISLLAEEICLNVLEDSM